MGFVKDFFSDAEFIGMILTGVGAMALFFIKPIADKFTQKVYPTTKSIQDIREIQLKEVYLPLYWKFRKYMGLPAKKLELAECRELYLKSFIKANKYPIYMEEDIIACIEKLGQDIKKHDKDSAREEYKRTAEKLLKNIKIQYLALKKSLSYTTNISFRSFRSMNRADQFYYVSYILFKLSIAGFLYGLILHFIDLTNYLMILISFVILCISATALMIYSIISIIDFIKAIFRR